MTRVNEVTRSSRSRLSTLNSISASATLLFALSLSVTNLAGAAPQKVQPVTKVAAHHTRISPPHAGVKLLEDILSRMRNLPQIAMTKNQQSFQYRQAQQSTAQSQGATDQLLAIRPKESSSKAKAEKRRSTIAMAEPKQDSFSSSRSKDMGRMDDAKSAWGADSMRRASQQGSWGSTGGKMLAQQPARGAFLSGLPSTNMGAYVPNPNAYNASTTNNKGIQNFDQQAEEITKRLSPEARQRLTASTSRLYDVAKKLEEAQQMANNLGKQSAGGGGSGYANTRNQILADERHAPGGGFRAEQKQAKVISTNPLITEYDKTLANAGASAVAGDAEEPSSIVSEKEKPADKTQTLARAMPTPAAPMSLPFGANNESNWAAQRPPAEPSLFKHVREFLNRDGTSIANAPKQQAEGAEKSKPIEVALLPPSVVTGIPLVRLGTSESETNKALAGKGSLNKTKVNDWSVWSLQKPGNDEVSLQIYTRNGQVEAIRIFDTSLISPEFGVKLGDELTSVKQRFGEPAFILSEPQSRGGQNYVYPISQVSFQLAMASRTSPPKVVSLLIFNAK